MAPERLNGSLPKQFQHLQNYGCKRPDVSRFPLSLYFPNHIAAELPQFADALLGWKGLVVLLVAVDV